MLGRPSRMNHCCVREMMDHRTRYLRDTGVRELYIDSGMHL